MKRLSCCGRCSNYAGVLLSQFVASVGSSRREGVRLRLPSLLAAALLVPLGLALASTASAQTYTGVLSGTATPLPLPAGQPDNYPTVYPYGVAVDASGNLYVTDLDNARVLKETPLQGGGYSESVVIPSVTGPEGIAVDNNGNLYLACPGASRVLKETLSGGAYTESTVAAASSGLVSPVGVAVDGSGNVYIADTGSGSVPSAVYKETLSGNSYSQTTIISGSDSPSAIAVDANGNVYIADSYNSRILMVSPSANSYSQTTIASGLNNPSAIAVDNSGNVYYATLGMNYWGTGQLFRASPNAGSYTQEPLGANLGGIEGLATDTDGNLFVANINAHWLMKDALSTGSLAVNVGSMSPLTAIFTFDTFDSTSTLGSISVSAQGAGSLDFADAHTGSCSVNSTYSVLDTCTVQVNFTPVAPGPRYGGVVLLDDNANVIATAYLQATGVAPQVNFLPGTPSILPTSALAYPFGVAADASGNIYIADTNNDRVLKETLVGGSYSESTVGTDLNEPEGVAADGAGNVYIADSVNGRLLKETFVGGSYSQSEILVGMPNISGVAVDGSGNLYVADPNDNQVLKVVPNSSGGYDQSTVGSGLSQPYAVTVDASGDVYIADTFNSRVLIETPSAGSYVQTVVAESDTNPIAPNGVAVDGNLNVYIADGNSRVLKETPSGGAYTETVLSVPSAEPWGITVDGAGNVYVVESDGGATNEVVKLDYADAPSVGFGSTEGSGGAQTMALENFGNAPLHFPAPSSGKNPSISANYTLTSNQSGDCPLVSSGSSAGQLAPNASCLLTMSFTPDPTLSGSVNGQLVLKDDALNAPSFITQSIALSGTATATATLPTLSSPAPGSTLGTSATFTWTQGTGVSSYRLQLGTTGVGTNDLYDSGWTTGTSATVSSIPSNGVTVFVRLYSMVSGIEHSSDYTFTESGTAVPAALSSPTPGTTLGSSATFTWTKGTGVNSYRLWLGTSGVGTNDLFDSGWTTATSATVSSVPSNGVTVFVRLYSKVGATLQSSDYTFTESGTAVPAALSSPAPGTTLGSSATFTWTKGTGVNSYRLWLGTSGVGTNDLFDSGWTTATSATVSSVPSNGVTVFVRLYSKVGASLQSSDYMFMESGTAVPAALSSPVPGTTLGSSATFTWTKGTGVNSYRLFLGTTGVGANDLFDSGWTTATTATVSIPSNGVTVFVRLYSKVGATLQSSDYMFMESGTAVPAALSSPVPGTTLGSSATFTWTKGTGVSSYRLWLGTTGVGTNDLFDSGWTTATAATVSIPSNGVTVFVRVYSKVGATLQSSDYAFMEPGTAVPAALSSPTPGTTLGSSATFTWTKGTGVSSYRLWLGTTGVGTNDLFDSGWTTATAATVSIPSNGVTVFVRVYSKVGATLQSSDYTFMESGTAAPAALSSPSPGTTLGSSATFTWTKGSGVISYRLAVGTTGAGSNNLDDSGWTTATSATVGSIPSNGGTVFVRVYSKVGANLQWSDYTFTESKSP